MSALPMDDGPLYIDGREIHEEHNTFWNTWFQGDQTWSGLLSSQLNPQALITDLQLFQSCISGHNIPRHVSYIIWKGLNSTSISTSDEDCIKHRVQAALIRDLDTPPSLQKLQAAILSLPSTSAGGISGLTYNQLKIWPLNILAAAHSALTCIWKDKTHPEFFKYKWLVPLSKLKEPGTPSLTQLRPIMLIETLRKVWTQLIVKRIRRVLETESALSSKQFGFRPRRSTMQPLLQFSSALEQVAEVGGEISGSTWDVVRAFDSIAKPLILLSLIRIGIPNVWAQYLIDLDADSGIITRSPWAENYIRQNGTRMIQERSKLGLAPNYFHAERGVGQGDVGSPTIWNIFMDTLLCSL